MEIQEHQANKEEELARGRYQELEALDESVSALKTELEQKTLEAEEHVAMKKEKIWQEYAASVAPKVNRLVLWGVPREVAQSYVMPGGGTTWEEVLSYYPQYMQDLFREDEEDT